MSVSTEITRILTAKNDIITALNNLGSTLDSATSTINDVLDDVKDNFIIPANDLTGIKIGCSAFTEVPDFIYRFMSNITDKLLPDYFFAENLKITYVKLPSNIWYIGKRCMKGMIALKVVDFSDVTGYVVRFANSGSGLNNVGTTEWIDKTSLQYIVVPDARYSEYNTTTYYLNFRSQLIKKSDYDKL